MFDIGVAYVPNNRSHPKSAMITVCTEREASTLTLKKRIESFAGAEGELARIDQLRKSKMEAFKESH